MFETTLRDGVLELAAPGARWLSTGWNGGDTRADRAYSITVPDDWAPDSTHAYVTDRLAAAGFPPRDDAPVLLTGVAQEHARIARCGSVAVAATAGLSNPAALPMDPDGGTLPDAKRAPPGTVNLVAATTRALDDAALSNLIAVAAEAKAATLLATAGFPGTTSDAVVVACDPGGETAPYSGSATPVGAATRACVREAVRASLDSRDAASPDSVESAAHGTTTDVQAAVFRPSPGWNG
ncbi:adenosylcobinamide amidohydrolase [Halobacterium sp. BOL4-2]|uniref:adenosylcobinamide amidohydrolase n=1 Tax=Halobacterium sp. BOL4-2 TaxID=2810537 RepID=UPI001962F6CE|nr:adenosylcobinamide amidohydrolase [Halobacterium sp. BOL4-2]QRY24004.1 adenosylcobinamide amidohydrolase CbiZ [Halobacterium sp. BOL4-2]